MGPLTTPILKQRTTRGTTHHSNTEIVNCKNYTWGHSPLNVEELECEIDVDSRAQSPVLLVLRHLQPQTLRLRVLSTIHAVDRRAKFTDNGLNIDAEELPQASPGEDSVQEVGGDVVDVSLVGDLWRDALTDPLPLCNLPGELCQHHIQSVGRAQVWGVDEVVAGVRVLDEP